MHGDLSGFWRPGTDEYLGLDHGVIPVLGLFGFVGLDAADVMRDARGQGSDEEVRLGSNLGRGRRGTTFHGRGNVVGEQRANELVRAILHDLESEDRLRDSILAHAKITTNLEKGHE